MRHFVIGDVHGCFSTLMALLKQLPVKKRDVIVFLGDYIDRGPRSFEVLALLQTMKKGTIFLKGNHEEFYLINFKNPADDKLERQEDLSLWLSNGGAQTALSFHNANIPLDTFVSFVGDLPLYYETEKFICVHAGINGTIEKTTEDIFLWERSFSNDTQKLLICGHTPWKITDIENQSDLLKEGKTNIIHVENGVFVKNQEMYGNLNAYCPELNQFWFQPNIEES
jgi:serine/threonine protein phosphatase 1